VTRLALQAFVRFIDGPQQFAERRRFLDRPRTIEGGAKKTQLVTREQSDSYDAILCHKMLRRLT